MKTSDRINRIGRRLASKAKIINQGSRYAKDASSELIGIDEILSDIGITYNWECRADGETIAAVIIEGKRFKV